MAAAIRLRREGSSKRALYRVVVADSRAPRGARVIEVIGHYNPVTNPPQITIDREKAQAWIAKGAQASNTVKKLIALAPKAGA